MALKYCNFCKKNLTEDQFHWKSKAKGIRRTKCKACHKKYCKGHYINNQSMYTTNRISRHKEIMLVIRQYKESTPCKDCGNTFPHFVTDFDHLHNKKANVSWLVKRGASLITIQNEIKKCDLVCANCHRIRTFSLTMSRCSSVDRASDL